MTERKCLVFNFAGIEVREREFLLIKGGERLPVEPTAFRVLLFLLRNAGRIVSKEEIVASVWNDVAVSDNSLTRAIAQLRRVLDDDPREPRYILTVPTLGYRFLTEVKAREDGFGGEVAAGAPSPGSATGQDAVSGADNEQRWVVPSHQKRRAPVVATIAVFVVAALAVCVVFWRHSSPRLPDRSQWVQLTRFPDSVTQPALSPDGRMVAFIRGYGTSLDPGQIYIKMLPDGQPVQLTHSDGLKMSPVFSPDGSRVAYTTVDFQFHWDTSVIPTLGGEPQPLLRNASGLIWTSPGHVLFSEIKSGVHMGIVAAQENRIEERSIYLPEVNLGMAHRSYLSPDGKWVLLVEMDQSHEWVPCRLVPADGSTQGRYVGPVPGGCTVAAWTPDGKWMYFTSDHGGMPHIWRQRFPDGKPEQVTSGPTEEEGIAMAPDGRSFVTAVAVQNTSLWVHDAKGERQVSVEGNAHEPKFTPDGKKLCYLTVMKSPNQFAWYRNPGELQVADLESGRSEPLVPSFPIFDYDISRDGRLVVMSTTDREGKPRLWVMPFDRSSPPVQIPNVEGTAPKFGAGNEIFFRELDAKPASVYRVHPDGTGLREALAAPVFLLWGVSPDGHWIHAWAPIDGHGPPSNQLFPLDGGTPIQIGTFQNTSWTLDGRSVFIDGFLFPLKPGEVLPKIPAGGFQSFDEVGRLPGAHPTNAVALGPSESVYAFSKNTVQRNLFRIPIS